MSIGSAALEYQVRCEGLALKVLIGSELGSLGLKTSGCIIGKLVEMANVVPARSTSSWLLQLSGSWLLLKILLFDEIMKHRV